ncbi:MAG TPA: AAA family ATPase [Gemmataceae bacterium]|jgi:hypothetical protein
MTRRLTALDRARRELADRNGHTAGWRADQLGDAHEGPPPAPPPPAGPRAVARCAAAIEARPVDWLWPGRVPRGMLTLLDGDPGLGKSSVVADLAARVTRGWAMPPAGGAATRPPAAAILLNAEDSPEHTIRPRLEAAGADLDRVHVLEAITDATGERPPSLPWDVASVEALVRETGAGLIGVDPLMAYLGAEVNAHRDQDVRRALYELKRLAERTGAAVLVVRHLNKFTGGPALYRGGGSIGIIGAARSALVVGRDPGDPARRVLAVNKCNIAAPARGIAYTIEAAGGVGRIGWGEECDLSADDILAVPERPRGEATGEAERFLRELLAGGPVPAAEAERQAAAAGISDVTLRRAKKRLGVIAGKAGFVGPWAWRLPADPAEGAQAPGSERLR